ncbi:TRAP transporter large permease subunit [Bordetella petrii]|nr:TRAP transporter large permease subunit [Bordetella petrii]
MTTIWIFLASLLGSMGIGMPIAFALLVSGLALMWQLSAFDPNILAESIVNGADSFSLIAVPFFMLAGELMAAGGMSRRIVKLAIALFGHLKGGIGYVAIGAAILMACLSGSAVADSAALAVILIPMMRDAGYDVSRSCGLMASGGIIAPVIPPSIGLIIFGVAANVSITKLFLAGIFPGLLMGGALALTWWWLVRREHTPVRERAARGEVARAAIEALPALIMPVIIVGGLRLGVFTPTEAAVVAAVYALLAGLFIYRELTVGQLYEVFLSASKTSASVMFLVAAAFVSAWLITIANIPGMLAQALQPLVAQPTLLMLTIVGLVMIVGTALDFTPSILILTPVLMPVVQQAGIDPVYFGVIFVIANALGLLTPPVGVVLNVVCSVAGIRMEDVSRGVLPFLLAEFLALILMVLFPALITYPLALFHD